MFNPVQNAIFAQALGYLGAMIAGYIIVNFLSNGFLGTFLKVKASRGKFILVRIRTPLNDFFKSGMVIDGSLTFKGRDKTVKTLALPKNKTVIFRSMNVNCIDVDENKNCIICVDWSAVSGYDASKFDSLLTRALMQPSDMDKMTKILIILVIAAILVGGFSAFFSYNTLETVKAIAATTAGIAGNVITGGNIPPAGG